MKPEQHIKTLNIKLIARELVDVLSEKNLKISTAESCTGGLISKLITDIPGASYVFECGICAYSNYIKKNLLSVSSRTLKNKSAVSKETAMEMAAHVRLLANADIGISTTGYAGPKNLARLNEPVGLIYIGLSNMTKTTYLHLNFASESTNVNRNYIRVATAYKALSAALDLIKTGVIK